MTWVCPFYFVIRTKRQPQVKGQTLAVAHGDGTLKRCKTDVEARPKAQKLRSLLVGQSGHSWRGKRSLDFNSWSPNKPSEICKDSPMK